MCRRAMASEAGIRSGVFAAGVAPQRVAAIELPNHSMIAGCIISTSGGP